MNQTHLHLLITHLPIIGSILGALVLAYGIWTQSIHTKIAAYGLLVISSIGAGIAYITGEAAEETVEHLQGIVESKIEQHEDFALYALIGLILLGLFSIISLYVTIKKHALANLLATVTLLLALLSFGLVAYTGYLGGMIRHTEIGDGAVNKSSEKSE